MNRHLFRSATARLALLSALLFCLLAGCDTEKQPPKKHAAANADLKAHSNEFRQEVIRVTDGVYVAVGYGLANSILLEGADGVVIVDAMESREAGARVKAEFDKITKKPVKAIVYTHNHADHIFGAKALMGNNKPDVYAHETTAYYIDRLVSVVRNAIYRRSMRQFGALLEPDGLVNCGIGPRLVIDENSSLDIVRPTKTFKDKLSIEVAGLKLELMHAPGETMDQIAVWIPSKKVLLPADDYYKSFPNLYAIRGTPYRDVMLWVKSLDKMRSLGAEYLVPSHSRPLKGADNIRETLTNYRDAIQYVHDRTLSGMNRGLTPDQLVEVVKLPPHLANLPYLQPYYGTVAWSVRAVFDGYLGWFSGNPSKLFPLPPKKKARRMAALAGGEDKLAAQAEKALKNKDYQWALELTDHLMALDPKNAAAIKLRTSALEQLGAAQINANARHYYLTRALELERGKNIPPIAPKAETVKDIPLQAIFDLMAVNLDPEKSAEVDKVVAFRFPDSGEDFTVHVRRGVAEIHRGLTEKADITVTANSIVWKEIVAKLRNPLVAYAKGDVSVDGGKLELVQFLGMFKAE